MKLWDALKSLAPRNSESPVSYLAKQSKLPQRMFEHIRDVRNKCAHPIQRGQASEADIVQALAYAREAFRRLAQGDES